MVMDKKEGLLFEKGNVKALANAIVKIWEEEVQVDTMSNNARERARNTHNADENYQNLLKIYKKIVM